MTSDKEMGEQRGARNVLCLHPKEERRDSRKRRRSRNLSASRRTERRTRGGRTVDPGLG